MTDAPGSVSPHPDATRVFVPLTVENSFISFAELATGRQWAHAFTSETKAKAFVRVMREAGGGTTVNRLLPCTLGEWKDRQTKKAWPDLWIDADPHAVAEAPGRVAFDPARQNIRCLTTEHPGGTFYRVQISPRDAQAG
jgi:hypothetical protein